VGSLLYSMSASADGFIEDREGEFGWSAPSPELFRFHTDRVGELSGFICGRRLYETMLYWESVQDSFDRAEREFASIWQSLPKVVFSRTLETVEGNARLATEGIAEEVARLLDETGGDVEVGGATLAGQCIQLDLVDEFRLFVNPVLVGGGKPFFPPVDSRLDLELAETRQFGAEAVLLRFRRRR
jgi:dihydrofolate reductase